jgi:parvulin-like peptidyl-prolyl isomerase
MKRRAFITLFSLLAAVGGFAQADLQPAAIVNLTRSEPITVKQLRTEVERMEKGTGRALTQQQRRDVLDALINEKLAIQAAEKDRITVSENEVTQQVNQVKAQMAQALGRQPTDAEFAEAIKSQTGMDMQAFRDQTRRQIILQNYLLAKKKSHFDSVKTPSDADILNEYNLRRTQLVRPDTVRLSMIQVAYGSDAAAKTRAKELADSLMREIGSSPSKFDEVVLRGKSPSSNYQAGDAGYLPRNPEAVQAMGQEFINTAFSLKQGEVSKVIEGRAGYQIIKITETYAYKNLDLDDIVQPGSPVTVRGYIGNFLLQERQMEAYQKATLELVTELRAGKTFQVFEKNLIW